MSFFGSAGRYPMNSRVEMENQANSSLLLCDQSDLGFQCQYNGMGEVGTHVFMNW